MPDFTNIVAELLAPNSDSSHGALEKISVEVRSLNTARSLTDVKQETVKEIQQWFANSEILENGETHLAGRQAYLLVYEGTDGGREIRRMRVATVKNNREYALIYEADLSHYEMQKKSAQQIIDSFDWLNFSTNESVPIHSRGVLQYAPTSLKRPLSVNTHDA